MVGENAGRRIKYFQRGVESSRSASLKDFIHWLEEESLSLVVIFLLVARRGDAVIFLPLLTMEITPSPP